MPVSDEVLMQRFKLFLFSIVWIGCVIGLVISISVTREFLDQAVTAPGRVVALNAGGSHPQIEFTNSRGELVSYPQGGWIGGYKVGDTVTVLYLENSPNPQATIDRFGAIWAWSINLVPLLVMLPATLLWNVFFKYKFTKNRKSKWNIPE